MATLDAKRTVAVATIALAGTIGAGVALAQMAKGAWGGDRTGRAYQRILARLNLTQDQRYQIDALLATEKPMIANLGQQLKADATALRGAAGAAQPDAGAVGAAFLKVKADRTALRAELQKVRSGTAAVLTPDQKGAFEAYLTTLHTMHHRWRPATG